MSVRVTGTQDASIYIKDVRMRLKNLEPAWAKVGSYLSQVNRRQFATEGAYLGKPWRPLKPEYMQWKIKNGYGRRKTLVQTGAMRASFTSRPMSIEVYKGDSATYGSNDYKAKWHQYGTHRNGKRAIPPRPIIVKTPKLTRDIRDIIAEYLVSKSRTRTRKYL
jgi:phage virion morphogenesis protein